MSNVEATGIHSSAGRSAPLAGAGHTAGSTAAPSVDDTMCTRTNIPARRMASRQKNGSPANGPREWVGDVCVPDVSTSAVLQRGNTFCMLAERPASVRTLTVGRGATEFQHQRSHAGPPSTTQECTAVGKGASQGPGNEGFVVRGHQSDALHHAHHHSHMHCLWLSARVTVACARARACATRTGVRKQCSARIGHPAWHGALRSSNKPYPVQWPCTPPKWCGAVTGRSRSTWT